MGLGFTQDELKSIEQEIRQEIVMVRDASDERYRYFTTNTQVTKEKRLIRAMESKAREGVGAPNSYVLEVVSIVFPGQPTGADDGDGQGRQSGDRGRAAVVADGQSTEGQ